MLVENRTRQIERTPLQHLARVALRERERHAFVDTHVVEIHGHREGSDLSLGYAAFADATNETDDVHLRERLSVALFTNNFLWQKHGGFLGEGPRPGGCSNRPAWVRCFNCVALIAFT